MDCVTRRLLSAGMAKPRRMRSQMSTGGETSASVAGRSSAARVSAAACAGVISAEAAGAMRQSQESQTKTALHR